MRFFARSVFNECGSETLPILPKKDFCFTNNSFLRCVSSTATAICLCIPESDEAGRSAGAGGLQQGGGGGGGGGGKAVGRGHTVHHAGGKHGGKGGGGGWRGQEGGGGERLPPAGIE